MLQLFIIYNKYINEFYIFKLYNSQMRSIGMIIE